MSTLGLPTHLAVFAKYWEPGRVKTRLGTAVGDTVAAAIYREFLIAILRRFRHIADRRTLVGWPQERSSEFRQIAPDEWDVAFQAPGELGQKLALFLRGTFDQGPQRIAVIGADSPDLPSEILERAFLSLSRHDVVLGPAVDGGYYLVGQSSFVPMFDNIPWSTTAVFRESVDELQRRQISFDVLDTWEDVDDPPSLNGLRRRLEGRSSDPDLAALLDRLSAILNAVPT